MKTKLFIDFDKTIFDTSQVKERLYRIFGQFGCSKEEIDRTYLAESLDGKFSPEGQAKRLNQIRPLDLDIIEMKIKTIIADSAKILYSDTIEFLDNIDRQKFEVDLLSYGDEEFQNRKVKHSGIVDKFDNIYITNIEKQIYLQENNIVAENDYFIVIDDKLDNLEKISQKYAKAFMMYMVRNIDDIGSGFSFKGVKVRNLQQASQYL